MMNDGAPRGANKAEAPSTFGSGQLINVMVHESKEVFRSQNTSVALHIHAHTTAEEVCQMIFQRLKSPYLMSSNAELIIVYTISVGEENAMPEKSLLSHSVLHTLKRTEKPLQVQEKALERCRLGTKILQEAQRRKSSVSDLVDRASPSPHDDHQSASHNDEKDENGGVETSVLNEDKQDGTVDWYYRDHRSTPLDLDASGSDESDDEATARTRAPQDMSHLSDDNCTRCAGFLLKRSHSDPNLWRKRFCILAGDKLWYMRRRPPRSRGARMYASCIPLVTSRVNEPPKHLKLPYSFELQTVERPFYFRAFGRNARREQLVKVQRGWLMALERQINYSDENEFIKLAEHICCDSEKAKARRFNSVLSRGLDRAEESEENVMDALLSSQLWCIMHNRATMMRFLVAVDQYRSLRKWSAAQDIYDEFIRNKVRGTIIEARLDHQEDLWKMVEPIRSCLEEQRREERRSTMEPSIASQQDKSIKTWCLRESLEQLTPMKTQQNQSQHGGLGVSPVTVKPPPKADLYDELWQATVKALHSTRTVDGRVPEPNRSNGSDRAEQSSAADEWYRHHFG